MKTAHRRASHAKRATMPKWFLPKMDAEQILDCQVLHWDLLERMTHGRATGDDLIDWVATGFTYSELMRLLEADGTPFTEEAKAAIAEQLECYEAVLQRFHTSGRVGFNGAQLLTARAAAEVMDQLIEMDRFGFAVRAAEWSNAQMARLQLLKD